MAEINRNFVYMQEIHSGKVYSREELKMIWNDLPEVYFETGSDYALADLQMARQNRLTSNCSRLADLFLLPECWDYTCPTTYLDLTGDF